MIVESAWELFRKLENTYGDIFYDHLTKKSNQERKHGDIQQAICDLLDYTEKEAIEIMKQIEKNIIKPCSRCNGKGTVNRYDNI